MPYTLGPTHIGLTGSGSISVARPAGLRLVTSSIPSHIGFRPFPQQRYFRLGRVAWGTLEGFWDSVPIEFSQQVVYPLPDQIDIVAYDLVAGAQLTIVELAGGMGGGTDMPWDRNPTLVNFSSFGGVAGGTSTTQAWTYTVPAGRKLYVTSARATVQRSSAASAAINAQGFITVDGSYIAQAVNQSNVVGFLLQDPGTGAGLILPSGRVIAGFYQNSDSGGNCAIQTVLTGYIFDA